MQSLYLLDYIFMSAADLYLRVNYFYVLSIDEMIFPKKYIRLQNDTPDVKADVEKYMLTRTIRHLGSRVKGRNK